MTSNTTKTGLSGSDFVGSVRTLVLTTALALPQLRYFVFNNLMQVVKKWNRHIRIVLTELSRTLDVYYY